MKQNLVKYVLALLIVLTPVSSFSFQSFTFQDQVMLHWWFRKSSFDIYSSETYKADNPTIWTYTLLAVQAMHLTQPDQFYRYLAKVIVSDTARSSYEITQLLHSVWNLNLPEQEAFNTLTTEKNDTTLADWLSYYIELEKFIANDADFYAHLFELLIQQVVSDTQSCNDEVDIESYKSERGRRYYLLQCIAQATNLNIIDIDISYNRVVTTRLLAFEPIAPDVAKSSAIPLDPQSENQISATLKLYHNPAINPVILFTSQFEKGFLLHKDLTNNKKAKTTPPSLLEASEKRRMKWQQRRKDLNLMQPKRNKQDAASKKKENSSRRSTAFKILVPTAVVIGVSIAVGALLTYLMTTLPYPGNPWLPVI